MSFVFRLQRYQTWLAEQRRLLEETIHLCRAERQKAEHRCREWEDECRRLIRAAEKELQTGIAVEGFLFQRLLLDQATRRLEQERETLCRLEKQLAELLAEWRALYQRQKAVDRLFQRRFGAYLREVERKEQRALDEWAAVRGGEA